MNITATSFTNGTLTVIVDNGLKILTARNDHPRWAEIQEAYKTDNYVRLTTLLSMQAVYSEYSNGKLSINGTGIMYDGHPLHTLDANRVLAFLRDGLPFKPIANYIARKMENPSARAITEMYSFLEHQNMPLTPNGFIIAYKGVQNDYYSVTGNLDSIILQGVVNSEGQILNNIGAVIEMKRSSVDDDFTRGCSSGLHAGSLAYAKGFGQRIVLVCIDPADVVSVPSDCNCQKLRCCKYTVVGEYTGEMPNHYTNEFTKPDDESEEDDESDYEFDHMDDKASEPNEPFEQFFSAPDPGLQLDIIKARLDVIMRGVLPISASEKINIADTINKYGCDSLDVVELAMGIEEEFGFEIPMEDEDRFNSSTTVKDLLDYIQTKADPTYDKGYTNIAPEISESYPKGFSDGNVDSLCGVPSRFLAGDQSGADSKSHAEYINGYLDGYTGYKSEVPF